MNSLNRNERLARSCWEDDAALFASLFPRLERRNLVVVGLPVIVERQIELLPARYVVSNVALS